MLYLKTPNSCQLNCFFDFLFIHFTIKSYTIQHLVA